MTSITGFTRMALNTCALFEDQECRDLLAGKALAKSPGAEHAVGHWVMKHRFAKTAAILTGWFVGWPLVCLASYLAFHHPGPVQFIVGKALCGSAFLSAIVLVAMWCAYQAGEFVQDVYDPESEFVKRAAARLELMAISVDRAFTCMAAFGLVGGPAFLLLVVAYAFGAIEAGLRE